MPNHKVLFVDDDSFLRKVYSSELSEKGFTVTLAQDGAEGIEAMKNDRPDIVILDLIMPKKDGFEVLAEMQESDELKMIPVIILSNLAQSEDQQRALDMGAKDFLVKDNTTLDIIADKISQHVISTKRKNGTA